MVSVTSAIKIVRNLHHVEDDLSLKSPVLSVLVKYESMMIPIHHDFDTFATYFKESLTLPYKPYRRNTIEPCNPLIT